MILFRVILILQALCLVPILIRFLFVPPDFNAVGLWFFAIGVSSISAPYALWQFIRHRPRRVWAGLMLLLAATAVGAPLLIARFDQPPLPIAPVAVATAIGLLIALLWLLARPGFWTDRAWAETGFNRAVLIALVVSIVLVAAPLMFGLMVGFGPPLGNDRSGLSLEVLLIHGASLGILGLILALLALVFSLLGLFRNRTQIRLHAAQLIAALILVGLLLVEAAILSIMMVNPG